MKTTTNAAAALPLERMPIKTLCTNGRLFISQLKFNVFKSQNYSSSEEKIKIKSQILNQR